VNITSDDGASVATPGTKIPTAFDVEHTFGGSAINDGRTGIGSYLLLNATTNATNSYRYYAAGYFFADTSVNDNGSGGTPLGNLYGFGAVARLKTGATNWKALISSEDSISAQTGTSVQIKAGHAVIPWPDDAVAGTLVDTGYWLSANTGGVGLTNGFQIDNAAGQYPVVSGGTIFKSINGTVNNGFDISLTTVTTCAYKSSGFCVDGSGNATVATLKSTSVVIASLPACGAGNLGAIATVSDGTAYGVGGYGSAVSATGAVTRVVVCTNTAGATTYAWAYN
jgi:hypothetical protein